MNASDLIHYYETRMNAFSAYSNLVWNRFNWFITLQVIIFGFLFTQQTSVNKSEIVEIGIPIVSIVISILWLVMGVEDYISLKRHGRKTTTIEINIKNILNSTNIMKTHTEERGKFNFKQSLLLIISPILAMFTWVLILQIALNK